MKKETILKFQDVSKSYQDKVVVNHLNFEIKKGECITILGTSGSGKTTTLKMINRLVEPTSGQIILGGQFIRDYDVVNLRRQIGYVVQQIGLFPHMTVYDNIALIPRLLSWEESRIERRVQELLTIVELDFEDYAKRYPKFLSGGQQQRVGVARSLAADPNIVLLDEPFSAIDAITRHRMQKELLAIHQKLEDKTFIFITHDVQEALLLGHRVMVMDKGEICQFDTPQNIVHHPKTPFVKELIATIQPPENLWSSEV